MSVIANRVKVAVDGTPGTGTINLGAAVTGFQSFADGGITNGQVVSYAIEDGDDWEVGTGTYTTGTPNTLSRTVIESSNSDAPLDLSSNAVVFITALSGDLQNAVDMDQGVATTDSPSFAGATFTGDISDGTNSVETVYVVRGSAKAWLQYLQVTPVLSNSFNVSSVTDNTTGSFTVNYTSAFSTADHARSLMANSGSFCGVTARSTTNTQFLTKTSAGTDTDTGNYGAFHGDLA